MKKYKCIKAYPHGPTIGKEIHDSWPNESRSLANFPEFWEEVIDPDYKIVRFHDGFNQYYRTSEEEFTINLTRFYKEKDLIKKMDVRVISVRRISDDVTFNIGDIVFYKNSTFTKWQIDNFYVKDDGTLIVRSKDNEMVESLEDLKKVDPTSFMTEDGKELTEKDEFWVVALERVTLVGNRAHTFPDFSKDKTKYLRFASKEYALLYIAEHKPCLSVKNITDTVNLGLGQAAKLKLLVRSKL